MYIGYGSFNQAPPGNILGRNPNPRIAKFTASLYPEAIYDWIRMLAFISSWQRLWTDITGIFTGNTLAVRRVKYLNNKLIKLENKVQVFGEELEKYKSFELYDMLEDHGDPFPLLNTMNPDAVSFHYIYIFIIISLLLFFFFNLILLKILIIITCLK